ncbi:MAG: hypothetical protein ACOH2D_12560 [Gelidibacter sp.]
MKNILLTILTLFTIAVNAQENNKITWNSGEFYYGVQNQKTGKMVYETPQGIVEKIIYDKFFKSYDIQYADKNNSIGFIDFEYVRTMENGTIIVKEETNGMFAVSDLIEEYGILLFVSTKKIDDENLLILSFKKISK